MRLKRPTRLRHPLWMAVIACFVALVVALGLGLRGLSDFDLNGRHVEVIRFNHENTRLEGNLVLPDADHDGPIALFVHGDGPQDRFANDAYLPLINALLDQGIGIYTWDKPGIGNSNGNWLWQSMQDRASEVTSAITAITKAGQANRDKIGVIGFSQAGWVVPKASMMSQDIAFDVIIGGAVNWQDQGDFYARKRLLAAGMDEADITDHIRQSRARDSIIFAPGATYESYLAQTDDQSPLTKDRFTFIKLNINADASADLSRLRAPTLALWGEDDLNVDARSDAKIYRNIITDLNPDNAVMLVPDATHGLLRSNLFNHQSPDDMPPSRQVLFAMMGCHAYAPGAIDHIADWIRQVTTKP